MILTRLEPSRLLRSLLWLWLLLLRFLRLMVINYLKVLTNAICCRIHQVVILFKRTLALSNAGCDNLRRLHLCAA